MKYIKNLFADSQMYEETNFNQKIHEDGVLLKMMQEILPEEHLASVDFRFPEKNDNRNLIAKTDKDEEVDIGLLVTDKDTWQSGVRYLQKMMDDEIMHFAKGYRLRYRTYYVLFSPADPWKQGKDKYVFSVHDKKTAKEDYSFKSRMVVVCPEN